MLAYLEEETVAGCAIDYVIVHKLDRLVRNRYDDTTLGRRFDELGVREVRDGSGKKYSTEAVFCALFYVKQTEI